MAARIPQATHEGILHIGDAAIPCAVLEDGRRLLTQSGFMKALGRARQAKGRQYYDADVNMPAFLTAKNLKPFIPNNLAVTSTQVEFLRVKGGKAFGYPAEILPKVCDVFLDADEAGALAHNQKHIAATAKMLMRGLAHVGIVALVDEATGYQEVRDRLALQAILDAYLRKELAAWAKRFPDEFYQQMFRLKGWQWRGMSVNRPSVVGRYTNDLVYERLAPGILEELRDRNPKDEKGQRLAKHHQWLTEDVGHPALAQHLHAVIGFMRASSTWESFYRMMQRAFPKKGHTIEVALGD
jgi:P63C domain